MSAEPIEFIAAAPSIGGLRNLTATARVCISNVYLRNGRQFQFGAPIATKRFRARALELARQSDLVVQASGCGLETSASPPVPRTPLRGDQPRPAGGRTLSQLRPEEAAVSA